MLFAEVSDHTFNCVLASCKLEVQLSRNDIRDLSKQASKTACDTQVVSMAPELFHTPLDVSTAAEFFSAKLADRCTVCLRTFAFACEVCGECTCHTEPRS
jgi:hypothetical protein